MEKPTIILGADHAGCKTKNYLRSKLIKEKYTILDHGVMTDEISVDYPDVAQDVAKTVVLHNKKNPNSTLGVLVCGTGIGIGMAANKVKDARAAIVYDDFTAKLAREHNHANIVALRGRKFSPGKAWKLLKTFLKSKEDTDPRHVRRVLKMDR